MATAKIVVPVRYSAWLCGELGHQIQELLANALAPCGAVKVSRLPRALLVEADEDAGPLLEAAHRAACDMELAVATAYPVFHHEMGPVWTGTLQAVFPADAGAPVMDPRAAPVRDCREPLPATA